MNNAIGAQTPEGRMYDAIELAAQRTPEMRLSHEEQELIRAYRRLPDVDQQALLKQTQQWVTLNRKHAKGRRP